MKNKLLHSFRLRATMLVAMMLCVVNAAWAEEETITFSDKYSANTVVDGVSIDGTNFSVTFNKRDGGTATQYYTNGTAVRWYGGGTLVVSSTNTITQIEITFTQTANSISTNVGNYESGTWTGSANSVTFTQSGTSGQCRISAIKVTFSAGGSSAVATTTTIDDTGITNTDVYTSTAAGSLAANVTAGGNAVTGATVTWSGNNDAVATIAADGTVTLVAAGSVTFTATYAGVADTYQSSSNTYELTVTSSAPYVQPTTVEITPNYTFWGKTAQFSGSDNSELSGSQDNVTLNWTRGNGSTYANTTAMRFYKDNTLTFTAPTGYEIKSIELSVSGTYNDLTFAPTGYVSETTTWTGASQTVTMSRPSNASSYSTISKFTITIGLPSNDPSISANDVDIPYYATSGTIAYTLTNEVTGGVVTAATASDWLTVGTPANGSIALTCEANEANNERTATVTITYTYNTNETVTKEVTVTQAAAPVIYTTIPALFAAATSTATDVNVTFGGWVVSAVHSSNAYLTDNQGHGLIIYASGHGFQVNDVLTGTVSCKLQIYRGSAELTNLTTSTDGLTVTNNGSVTAQNIAISELGGLNTGALLSFEGLSYNGTALVDGNSNAITPYTTLYSGTFENGKSYDVTGIYVQYNDTKEILPRSADDIEEVQVQHQDYDLTVTLNDNVSAIYVFDAADQSNPLIADGAAGTVQVADATQVLVSPDVASGYVLGSLTVDGVDVTEQMNEGSYSFTMPTHAVSITATATASSVTPATSGKYVKVTSNEDLTDGQYLIVYDEGSLAFDGSLGTLDAANNTISVTISDNEIAATTATEAAEFTIDVTNGTILSASGYYIGRTSDSNGMNSSTSDAYTNTLSIDADGGNADIVSGGAYLRYNATSGQDRFRYFKSTTYTSQKAIQLYKRTESVTITSALYAAIVTKNNVSFYNSGVTAYIVTATATDQATLTEVEEAPAGTPLIVKAAAGTYNLTVINDATNVSGNLLQASNGTVEGDGSTIFALGNKDGVGFYVVGDGVKVPAGKPYLEISGSAGIKSFLAFNFGITTAISSLDAQKAERGTIYNLAGQRVNKAVKGIFIQNGKKIVVK